jgi:hypothetical protein
MMRPTGLAEAARLFEKLFTSNIPPKYSLSTAYVNDELAGLPPSKDNSMIDNLPHPVSCSTTS